MLVAKHLLLLVLYTPIISEACKLERPDPVKCCPDLFHQLCCISIPRCNQSNTEIINIKTCENNTDVDCQAGYISFPNGKVIPVPGGYYSPEGVRCAIPCVDGAYCPTTFLTMPQNATWSECVSGVTKCCKHPNGEVAEVNVRNISGELTCAGMSSQSGCPGSFYCPNKTTKIACMNQKLCPNGSIKPLKCNLFETCDTNDQPMSQWLAILVLVIILLVMILLYTGHEYRRTLKQQIWQMCPNFQAERPKSCDALNFGLTNIALHSLDDNLTIPKKDVPIDISFSKISYKVGVHRILPDVSGCFRHSQLSAIMGPSGCGKTTLLNILRGKLRKNVTGTISLNDSPFDFDSKHKAIIGFAPQNDIMHSWLTVKEVLTYSAHIHLPEPASGDSSIHENVSNVMTLLGISAIADDVVGGEERRGISGGQQRRLNLGIELVKNPTILFCDEPTSGLDSSTSLELIRMLQNIAHHTGINIICVIHQPRYECFALFQEILLLNAHGRVIYDGDGKEAKPYFERLGYEVSQDTNPADFIIDIANGTSVSPTCLSNDLPNAWTDYYASGEKDTNHKDTVNVASPNQVNIEVKQRKIQIQKKTSWLRQIYWFYIREFVLQTRTIRLLLIEVVASIILGGILGCMYMEPKASHNIGKLAMCGMTIGMITVICSLKHLGNSWDVLLRESDGGINRFSFFIAMNLLALPIMIIIYPLAFLSFYHTLSDTRTTFAEHYSNLLCAIFAASGLGQMVSAWVNRSKMYVLAICCVLLSTFVAGSNISICDMDKVTFIGPLLYSLSYSRWFIEAQFESESAYYSHMQLHQIYYHADQNTYTLNNRLECILILLALGLLYRILAFIGILVRTR